MSASLAPVPEPGDRSLLAQLEAVVRDEFRGDVIRIAPDDPLFGRERCRVAECGHPARARGVCHSHYARWTRDAKPDMDVFVASTGPISLNGRTAWIGSFVVDGLGHQTRLEVGYVIQCRSDDPRSGRLLTSAARNLIRLLEDVAAVSMLDHPLDWWLQTAATRGLGGCHTPALVRYAFGHLVDLAEGTDAETEFARDIWRAAMIGVPSPRAVRRISFVGIRQPWLRTGVKRWARLRLTACSFDTVRGNVDALTWFSRFLTDHHPESSDETTITRTVLEHYLSWVSLAEVVSTTKNAYLSALRIFLDDSRRHGWLPGLSTQATIYPDEIPRPQRALPRFVDEFVMAQLEDPDRLALLEETTRHLLTVIIETGLRATDACRLSFNPLVEDSVGWPCLRYMNHKIGAEQLVPLSDKAAAAIRSQQAHLHRTWPDGPPPRLFPAPARNPDGSRPFAYETLRARFNRWQREIDLRDEAGQPTHVTPHQFRHTLGTRMINNGVPQHVVQKLLGHLSPEMTARYAHIHDTTVRAAFDDYQRRRVDIAGRRLDYDPDAPSADAEWIKHNLVRIAASLPNGYCGRPPQQDCPHPNACLTCPDFQTTPQFLPLHRRQRDDTLELLDTAEQAGNTRLGDNHRQVVANLERVITALETINDEEPPDATG